jgi:hypothetical protein
MTNTRIKWVKISDNTNKDAKTSDILAIRTAFSHSLYDDVSTLHQTVG